MYQEIIREVQQIYDEAEEIKGNMSGLKNGMTKREFWKMEWQSAAAKCPYSIVMNRVKNVVIRKYLESETESPIKGKKDKMDKAEIEKVLIFANKDRLFGRNFPIVEQVSCELCFATT